MYVVSSKEAKATASEGHNTNYEENVLCPFCNVFFLF